MQRVPFKLIRSGLAVIFACLLILPGRVMADDATSQEPLDVVPLVRLGYSDSTLQGNQVSADYAIPGPGVFLLADDNWIDLDVQPSSLLNRNSAITVLWNNTPLQDIALGTSTERTQMSIRLPRNLVDPDYNHLQIRGYLEVASDRCGDDTARYLTVFKSTQVRYSYVDRTPHPPVPIADLARYPYPFFHPLGLHQDPVLIVFPDHPTSAAATALLQMTAQLGQMIGDSSIPLEAASADTASAEQIAQSHLIVVGKWSEIPKPLQQAADTLRQQALKDTAAISTTGALTATPALTTTESVTSTQALTPTQPLTATPALTMTQGAVPQAFPAGQGALLEVISPWNPTRLALLVTGSDDQAVERAASALSSRTAIRTLRGSYALVPEITPASLQTGNAGDLIRTLADLGRTDVTISGVGDHRVSLQFDAPTGAAKDGLLFDAIISHSPLMDQERSSFRVVLNGVPIDAVNFTKLPTARGVTRITLPGSSLQAGPNTLSFEFSLQLPGYQQNGPCVRPPIEQAWAVLHAESGFAKPIGEPTTRDVTLALYPYPFVRLGRLDQTLVVVPDTLAGGTELSAMIVELGRATRADPLRLRAVKASDFDGSQVASDCDVIVFGLPQDNPLIAKLGERLPIQFDEKQRLVTARDITVDVRDTVHLGIVQEVASPWADGRAVLVVTARSFEGLHLAVEALRRRGLADNAALITQAEELPPQPGQTPTPQALVAGGARPEQLQVSTYRQRAAVAAPAETQLRRESYAYIATIPIAIAAILIVGALTYVALVRVRRQRRRQ